MGPGNASEVSACELLGLDPLYVANEGRFVAFVPESHVNAALDAMRRHRVAQDAVQIGTVMENALRSLCCARCWDHSASSICCRANSCLESVEVD